MRFKRSVVQDFPLPNIWGEDDTRFDKLRELGETLVSVTPLVDDKTLIDEISEIAESLYGGESR